MSKESYKALLEFLQEYAEPGLDLEDVATLLSFEEIYKEVMSVYRYHKNVKKADMVRFAFFHIIIAVPVTNLNRETLRKFYRELESSFEKQLYHILKDTVIKVAPEKIRVSKNAAYLGISLLVSLPGIASALGLDAERIRAGNLYITSGKVDALQAINEMSEIANKLKDAKIEEVQQKIEEIIYTPSMMQHYCFNPLVLWYEKEELLKVIASDMQTTLKEILTTFRILHQHSRQAIEFYNQYTQAVRCAVKEFKRFARETLKRYIHENPSPGVIKETDILALIE